jgi:hypothetical protein
MPPISLGFILTLVNRTEIVNENGKGARGQDGKMARRQDGNFYLAVYYLASLPFSLLATLRKLKCAILMHLRPIYQSQIINFSQTLLFQ